MQILPLKLRHTSFYCPVTGESLLFSEDYHFSPATLFYFSTVEGGSFIPSTSEIALLYANTLSEINNGAYSEYDFNFGYSDERKAFEILVKETWKQQENYLVFSLTNDGMACGPLSETIYIGIDMNYHPVDSKEQGKQFDFERWFPDFENYEDVLLNGTQTNPTFEGYALFMEDTMGCGGFYFFNTPEEWSALLPALVFLDYVNQDWQTIVPETLEVILKVYFDYFNADLYEQLAQDFTADLNALLVDYKIISFTKTIDLLEPNTDFSTLLIEDYDGNPQENRLDFLAFLKGYCRI